MARNPGDVFAHEEIQLGPNGIPWGAVWRVVPHPGGDEDLGKKEAVCEHFESGDPEVFARDPDTGDVLPHPGRRIVDIPFTPPGGAG